MWDNLVALLTEMLDLYKALLTISRQKREILIAGNAPKLETVTKQEETIILEIGKAEAKRTALVRDLADVYGVKPGELTMSKLKELADASTARQVENIGKDLEAVMAELTPLNETNTRLIEQALNYVNYSINILARNTTGPTYVPQGQPPERNVNNRTILDTKV